jgi:hypothetical protein
MLSRRRCDYDSGAEENMIMQVEPVRRRSALVLSILAAVAALIFTSGLRAEEPKACAALLSAAEVEAALGVTMEAVDPVEYSEGFTVCSWVKDRPEGQIGVNLSFSELKAIREGMVSAESVSDYFDLQLSSTRDVSGTEPQKLDCCGKRAVLFSEKELWVVMIELEKGFVHLAVSPGDVTRAKVEALARAVDQRPAK